VRAIEGDHGAVQLTPTSGDERDDDATATGRAQT
jgi:hypothetical protein